MICKIEKIVRGICISYGDLVCKEREDTKLKNCPLNIYLFYIFILKGEEYYCRLDISIIHK